VLNYGEPGLPPNCPQTGMNGTNTEVHTVLKVLTNFKMHISLLVRVAASCAGSASSAEHNDAPITESVAVCHNAWYGKGTTLELTGC
jgi:hypothetical protein